jgi:hypothetical protein
VGGLQVAAFQEARHTLHTLSAAVPALSVSPLLSSDLTGDIASDVCAGAIAGSLAALLTTPFDVIVTHAALDAGDGRPKGALQLGAALLEEHGPMYLLRGARLRMLYYAPLVGAFFGLYEYFRSAMAASGIAV